MAGSEQPPDHHQSFRSPEISQLLASETPHTDFALPRLPISSEIPKALYHSSPLPSSSAAPPPLSLEKKRVSSKALPSWAIPLPNVKDTSSHSTEELSEGVSRLKLPTSSGSQDKYDVAELKKLRQPLNILFVEEPLAARSNMHRRTFEPRGGDAASTWIKYELEVHELEFFRKSFAHKIVEVPRKGKGKGPESSVIEVNMWEWVNITLFVQHLMNRLINVHQSFYSQF